MQIASSTAGLYPVAVSSTKKPAAPSGAADAVLGAGQNARQLVPSNISTSSIDASRSQLLSRQRVDEITLVSRSATNVVQGSFGVEGLGRGSQNPTQSLVQRAMAEYASVETQQRREEIVELFGIDEFA